MVELTGTRVFRIDSELCAGHGRCYSIAPESFDADDSGYGVVTGRDESDRDEAAVARILGCCPEEAITVQTKAE